MKIEDYGIIISSYKFGDTAMVVKILSRDHGVVKGLMKGQKRHNSTLQSGNLVHFIWSARLSEHLGNFTISLEKAYSLLNFSDYQKILSISSIASLIDVLLPEREVYADIYDNFMDYLNQMADNNWLNNYVLLELSILEKTGFGIDMSTCAVTGTQDNITYISPKTGSAVSREIGDAYKSRLFKIPDFFLANPAEIGENQSVAHHMVAQEPELNDIIAGLEITRYFLAKHFFAENLARIPSPCAQFRNEINRLSNVEKRNEDRENRDHQLQGSA